MLTIHDGIPVDSPAGFLLTPGIWIPVTLSLSGEIYWEVSRDYQEILSHVWSS